MRNTEEPRGLDSRNEWKKDKKGGKLGKDKKRDPHRSW